MTCSNCNERPGTPVTVEFSREDRRISVTLCAACRTAIEAASQCTVRQPAVASDHGE